MYTYKHTHTHTHTGTGDNGEQAALRCQQQSAAAGENNKTKKKRQSRHHYGNGCRSLRQKKRKQKQVRLARHSQSDISNLQLLVRGKLLGFRRRDQNLVHESNRRKKLTSKKTRGDLPRWRGLSWKCCCRILHASYAAFACPVGHSRCFFLPKKTNF